MSTSPATADDKAIQAAITEPKVAQSDWDNPASKSASPTTKETELRNPDVANTSETSKEKEVAQSEKTMHTCRFATRRHGSKPHAPRPL